MRTLLGLLMAVGLLVGAEDMLRPSMLDNIAGAKSIATKKMNKGSVALHVTCVEGYKVVIAENRHGRLAAFQLKDKNNGGIACP